MKITESFQVKEIIHLALKEDLGPGDLTSASILSDNSYCRGVFLAKQDGILAGIEVVRMVFQALDQKVQFVIKQSDGQPVKNGTLIAEVRGPAYPILAGERTALNFLQRLSGIATAANHLVQLVSGFPVRVVDTRKTTPGLRILEKYAVRTGGAHNHRFGLYDAIMIKDNHIQVAGGIAQAVQSAKKRLPFTMKIEVEVETLEQVNEALDCGVDIILLDNMPIALIKEAVKRINGRAIIEASGGITSETILDIAAAGVDIISVGSLTHQQNALDISLDLIS